MEEQDIVCQQCEKKVSSVNTWCPHCDTQLKPYTPYAPEKTTRRQIPKENKNKRYLLQFFQPIFALVIVLFIMYMCVLMLFMR